MLEQHNPGMTRRPSTSTGAVACGHPITAQAAADVLREGGNAFDAVIAAQFAACVAEPVLTSLAGGGFLLAHPVDQKPVVYDFFAQTPRVRSPSAATLVPIEANFGTATQEFHVGLSAVATPGTVKGIFAIHHDLGSLPMNRLVEPAVQAARAGVEVNPFQAFIFDVVNPIYQLTQETARVYAETHKGDHLKQPLLADTLDALTREGERLFYHGELGARIVRLCQEGGGYLTSDDLASYQVQRRDPLALSYRGAAILTNPPPSSGGTLIGFALQMLNEIDLARVEFGSLVHLELLFDVMQLTNAARVDGLGRSEDGVLDTQLLASYRKHIANRQRSYRGTTHISVVDGQGNIAAMTLSNGEGCGHLVPDSGIMLNNMLGEEDINPAGLDCWQPGKRMTSMMAPTLIEIGKHRRVALGSGGSNRIRTAILQVISNLLDFSMDPSPAVCAPRIHFEGDILSIEPGFADPAIAELGDRAGTLNTWSDKNLFFGGVHLVEHSKYGFAAAGDERRGGIGVVV